MTNKEKNILKKEEFKRKINNYKVFGYLFTLIMAYMLYADKKVKNKYAVYFALSMLIIISVIEDIYAVFKYDDESLKNNIALKRPNFKLTTNQSKIAYLISIGLIYVIWKHINASKNEKLLMTALSAIISFITVSSTSNNIEEDYIPATSRVDEFISDNIIEIEIAIGSTLLFAIIAAVIKRKTKFILGMGVTGMAIGLSLSNLIKSNINFDKFNSLLNNLIQYKQKSLKVMLVNMSKKSLSNYVDKTKVNEDNINYLFSICPPEFISLVYDVYIDNSKLINEEQDINVLVDKLYSNYDNKKVDLFTQFIEMFIRIVGTKDWKLRFELNKPNSKRKYKPIRDAVIYRLTINGKLEPTNTTIKKDTGLKLNEVWRFVKINIDKTYSNSMILLRYYGDYYISVSDVEQIATN